MHQCSKNSMSTRQLIFKFAFAKPAGTNMLPQKNDLFPQAESKPLSMRQAVDSLADYDHATFISGYNFGEVISLDRPAPSIMSNGIAGSSYRQFVLKKKNGEIRQLIIAEIKRLSTFPDEFHLVGSLNKQWMRIGNSVPPLLMRAVALRIKAVMFE